jgi:hypothetical protein
VIAPKPKVHPALEADALASAHFKIRYDLISHVTGFFCLASIKGRKAQLLPRNIKYLSQEVVISDAVWKSCQTRNGPFSPNFE